MVESVNNGMVGDVPSVSGLILAGGGSRRMGGINKGLLEIGGVPIIQRAAATLRGIFREVIVVTNRPDEFDFLGLPMSPDLVPGRGSLGGLYTGLRLCNGSHGFLVACDMPFLDERVIRHIAGRVARHDVVIPRIGGLLEPLHAIYSINCIPHIQGLMDKGDLKILNLLPDVDVLEIPEADLAQIDHNLRFVINVNTLEDLKEARGLAI